MKRALREALSAAALYGACAGACVAQPLPSGMEGCRAAIRSYVPDDEHRQRHVELGDVCPDFATALAQSPWNDTLTVAPSQLWPEQLAQLGRVAARYAAPASARVGLDSLDAALREVQAQVPPPQLSLWQRLRNWLDARLGGRKDDTGTPGWLTKWLEGLSFSERWVSLLVLALGVTVVAATVAIVANELRVAGVLGRGAIRARAAHGPAEPVRPLREVRTLAQLRAAPVARQPALLLALVLRELRRRRAIAVRDSATHRELKSAAAALSETERGAFGDVAVAAERSTFGGWQPQADEAAALVAEGEALLTSLAAERETPR